MSTNTLLAKHGRLGSRKSHGGCFTCKIRKVKCGQERPFCQRCMSTGRKCDGYARTERTPSPSISNRAAVLRWEVPATYARAKAFEVQSFEYFIHRAVPSLARTIDGHFWHQLIPQLCHSDHVIWDAVNAFACLMQYPQYSEKLILPDTEKLSIKTDEHCRALRWYNRSIRTLRHRIECQQIALTTASMTCIIYICIECLQDNVTEAVALQQKAINLLNSTEGPESQNSIAKTVRALLGQMITAEMLSVSQSTTSETFNNKTLSSLADVRQQLHELMREAQGFISEAHVTKAAEDKDWEPPLDMRMRQADIHLRLAQWKAAVDNIASGKGSSLGSDEQALLSTLTLAFHHYHIILQTCLSNYETSYDIFFGSFEAILDCASLIIAQTDAGVPPVFSFETRVIPSLVSVARQCRHPVLRRQAISLLRVGPQMENTWKAAPRIRLAEKCVAIEESGNNNALFCPEGPGIGLPPENNRIFWDQLTESRNSSGTLEQVLRFGKWQQTPGLEWVQVAHAIKL